MSTTIHVIGNIGRAELTYTPSGRALLKGSVAVNGISLTIAEVLPESFAVWIIPHTRRNTNLKGVVAGDWLNVEFDLLAKYVERMLHRYAPHE